MKKVKAKAYGKVILIGEHAVVYGEPAIACRVNMPLSLSLTTGESNILAQSFIAHIISIFGHTYSITLPSFRVSIQSNIPIQSGMGSSASLAFALYQALFKYFQMPWNKQEIYGLLETSEKLAHGHPSGIDVTTILEGGVLQFQRQKTKALQLPKTFLQSLPFFLIQSGKPEETTKMMVNLVKDNMNKDEKLKMTTKHIGKLSKKFATDISQNIFSPNIFTQNEQLLEKLGVVGFTAKKMIETIEDFGGFAKTTGAGGVKQGSGMILAYHPQKVAFEKFLKQKGWEYYPIRIN